MRINYGRVIFPLYWSAWIPIGIKLVPSGGRGRDSIPSYFILISEILSLCFAQVKQVDVYHAGCVVTIKCMSPLLLSDSVLFMTKSDNYRYTEKIHITQCE